MSTPQFSQNGEPTSEQNTLPPIQPSAEVPSSYAPGRDAQPVPSPPYMPTSSPSVRADSSGTVPWWEPALVLVSTFLFLAILAPRIITYLSPVTGDEPFYLMTAVSMIEDRDINECNNYRQREEARFYPASVVKSKMLPVAWLGWPSAPYPLPPHAAKIAPSSRWCFGSNIQANYIIPDASFPLPADGTQNELYSKHGLGVSLLILLPYALGDRTLVVFFLNLLGALVAVNVYLLARERTGSSFVALLTWLAFSFTVPLLSYSYLIFPELPAALMAVYAFRRIWAGRNNALQLLLAGLCVAFMPWLHYRFAPISLGLGLYFLYTLYRQKDRTASARLYDASIIFLPALVSAAGLLSYFYFLYHQPFPNAADHAGISDVAGTIRGIVGAFVDKQWGLLTVSPIFLLVLFGLLLLAFRRDGRKELLWLGIIALPYFILISNYAQWWGEWCPPARYLTAILPLMALPFSYSLNLLTGARAAVYGFLYAALLVPSYLSSWAFIQQPQWFYNQPVQESQLLTKGLGALLQMLPPAIRPDLSISPALPSFVTPYFAYLKGKDLGDTWAGIAWQKSVLPFSIFGAILLLCLGLAWWQRRSSSPSIDIDDDATGNGHKEEPLPVRAVRRDPGEPVYSPRFALAPSPAFAPAGSGLSFRSPPTWTKLVLAFSARRAKEAYPAWLPEAPEAPPSPVPAPRGQPSPAPVPPHATLARWLRLVWRARSWWLALFALASALYGQSLVLAGAVTLSIRWYALGIILLFVAWTGTVRSWAFACPVARAPVHRPSALAQAPSRTRKWGAFFVSGGWRYVVALVAVASNVVFVALLRSEQYDSTLGGYGWLASVCLLLVAFLGQRTVPLRFAPGQARPEPSSSWHLSRRAEIALVGCIFLLALFLRFYRLDDWTMGMHGDEGEAGTDALAILNGSPASPFGTGWFAQPNFYYYALVYSMRIFGTGLLGLRFFSAFMGALVLLPVYGLARLWFGVRLAAIAAFLLAISDVALAFSRMQFSNITNPFFVAASLFFLFMGFKSGRTIFYILSAYSAMLTVYFYMGGRLAPFITAGVIGYALIFLPATGLASAYSHLRSMGLGAAARLRRAISFQFLGFRASHLNLVLFAVASYCFAAPFLYYYLDHPAEMDARTQEKLVFNNADRMVSQYGLNHDPLYIGLGFPSLGGPYPGLPLAFEHTGVSLQLAPDGFWPRVLWNQLTTSLSILTYHYDVSGVYTFSGAPVTKPIEAALVVLGIAWAIWRWRDARLGALNVWFWSTILVGGVLTIDAPYMARLVGIIPCLAVFAALVLDKLVAETLRLARFFKRRSVLMRRGAFVFSAGAVACLLAFLAWQNITDYFVRYASTYPFTVTTGMAVFVRDTNDAAARAGRPVPHYYNLGGPVIIWNYGVNRFLNYGTKGEDIMNLSDALPIMDDSGRDAVFMLWPDNAQYLDTLKSYYPGGRAVPFHYSADGTGDPLFISYLISTEELASHRVTSVAYVPLQGRRIDRQETGFGTQSSPPSGLAYPAQAIWSGGLVAPAFARYSFHLSAPNGASLLIDDQQILKVDADNAPLDAEVILARGPHRVQLSGRLNTSGDAVRLEWSAGGSVSAPIAPAYLWNGAAGGLAGTVHVDQLDPLTGPPPGDASAPVAMRRVDGTLGFRASDQSFQTGRLTSVTWQGSLDAPVDGTYSFDLTSNGGSTLTIDGGTVVDNHDANEASTNGQGKIELTRGRHNVTLRYNWSGGPGVVELYWTPPGGSKSLVGPEAFGPAQGVWMPGTILEPEPYQLPAPSEGEAGGPVLKLERTLGGPGDLLLPRGIAVDRDGRVFVGDRGHYRIVVYGKDGSLLTTWGSEPANVTSPGPGEFVDIADLALGADGTLYVLDRANPLIQAFDSQGHYVRAIDTRDLKAYNPNGIDAVAQELYVADTGKNRLLKVDTLQKTLAGQSFGDVPGSQLLDQPMDVAVLSVGTNAAERELFAVTQDSRVVEYSQPGLMVNQWPVQIGGNDGGSRITSWENNKLLISDPDQGRLALLDPATGRIHYFGDSGSNKDQLGVITGITEGPGSRLYVLNSDRDYVQVFTLENSK